jgi:hypothetical protein
VYCGLASENRARIAIWANDRVDFVKFARLTAGHYRNKNNPILAARFEQLVEEARQSGIEIPLELRGAVGAIEQKLIDVRETVNSTFAKCVSREERLQYALIMLVEQSGANGGYFYAMQHDELALVHSFLASEPSFVLNEMVEDYLCEELDGSIDVTITAGDDISSVGGTPEWVDDKGERYRGILLGNQEADSFLIAGIAVLRTTENEELQIPWELASALSEILLANGDIISTQIAY